MEGFNDKALYHFVPSGEALFGSLIQKSHERLRQPKGDMHLWFWCRIGCHLVSIWTTIGSVAQKGPDDSSRHKADPDPVQGLPLQVKA
jgi:hypothetical protein